MNRKLAAVALALSLLGLPVLGAEEDEGMAIYDKKCAMCHGRDGVAKAMAKGSANLNDPEWQRLASVDQVAKIVTDGKGKMPKYGEKLTPEEIRLVSTYVLKLEPPKTD